MRARPARGRRSSSERGELRFAPGGDLEDLRGRRWSVEGELATLGARVEDGRLLTPDYPDALGRAVVRAAPARPPATCCCRAAPGYEFVDWGGADHVGGGSHGSLHRERLARRAAVVRDGPGAPATRARSGRCRT